MSYILDALRKSEQERRNQDAATSFSAGMMNTQANAGTHKSPWIWVAVAVVVSANVLALLLIFKDQILGREEVIAPPELSSSQKVPSQIASSHVIPTQVVSAQAAHSQAVPSQIVPSHEQLVDPGLSHQSNLSVPSRYQSSDSTGHVGQISSQGLEVKSVPAYQSVQREQSAYNEQHAYKEHSIYAEKPAYQEDLGFDYSEADIIRPRTQPASSSDSYDMANPYDVTDSRETVEENRASLMSQYQRVQEESRRPRYEVVNVSKSGSEGVDGTGSVRAQLLDGLEEPQVIKPNSRDSVQSEAAVSYSQSEAESLPRIHDLTSLQKANVPPIRFSGHLYSSRPASRSIRLDGVKYKEGDRITRDLSLHSITEDGVVFDLGGSLFYMSSFDDWNGIN